MMIYMLQIKHMQIQGLSSRAPALQTQSPEFKLQH
jgi:hypothetical protein